MNFIVCACGIEKNYKISKLRVEEVYSKVSRLLKPRPGKMRIISDWELL
jgi:hypothetical protein